jgi:hypothetical protein
VRPPTVTWPSEAVCACKETVGIKRARPRLFSYTEFRLRRGEPDKLN